MGHNTFMELRESWAVGMDSANLKEKVGRTLHLSDLGTPLGYQSRNALGTCKVARILTLPNHIPLYF